MFKIPEEPGATVGLDIDLVLRFTVKDPMIFLTTTNTVTCLTSSIKV